MLLQVKNYRLLSFLLHSRWHLFHTFRMLASRELNVLALFVYDNLYERTRLPFAITSIV